VVAAGDAEGKDTAEDEDRPDHARDFGEWWGEELRGECTGVYSDAVHADCWSNVSIDTLDQQLFDCSENLLPERTRRTSKNLANPLG
jgi:hypothetical protein